MVGWPLFIFKRQSDTEYMSHLVINNFTLTNFVLYNTNLFELIYRDAIVKINNMHIN